MAEEERRCPPTSCPLPLSAKEVMAPSTWQRLSRGQGITAEQCRRGRGSQQSSAREGGAHSRAVQEREGLTAEQCKRGRGSQQSSAREGGAHSRAVQEREGLTAEQCRRGRGSQQSSAREGGAHSRAVQEREGLTAEQCKRGRGSQQSSAREGGAHSRAVQEREGLTAEQCRTGRGSQQSSAREGGAHSRAVQDREGLTAEQCKRGRGSLLPLVRLAVKDGHYSFPRTDHHTAGGQELQCRDAQTVLVLLGAKGIEEASGDVDSQNVPSGGSTIHYTVILCHLMQRDGTKLQSLQNVTPMQRDPNATRI